VTARAAFDADAYWRQFPVTAHFTEPMEETGTIIDLLEHRAKDEIIPKLRLQREDGTIVNVICGQTRLQAELNKHRPKVGDLITIKYEGEAKQAAPGLNRTKEFTVTVHKPGNQPAKPLKVPTPVPAPVTDEEYQKVVAARLAVTERARGLPEEQRDQYRRVLEEVGVPARVADRTVEDCDRAWEALDKLGCPPLQAQLGDDEPF